jgi:hypothetical protein
VKYAQQDDYASIRGSEGKVKVENFSVHDTVSAYVDSSKLCATPITSRLDSRRNYSMECIKLDERLPLSIDTAVDALPEDETFYRDNIPGSIDRHDSSGPTFTPDL